MFWLGVIVNTRVLTTASSCVVTETLKAHQLHPHGLKCSNQDLSPSHLTPPARSPLVCTVAPRSVCYLQSGQRCNSLRVSFVPWRDCLLAYTKLGACALPSAIKGPSSC